MGLCGVHIVRTVVEDHKAKIVSSRFIEIIKADIAMLRNDVGSQCQFAALAKVMVNEWKRQGEEVFALYFEIEYLTPPYDKWSCNSFPKTIAIPVENQIVESSHRTDKRDNHGAGNRKKVGLSSFCTTSIPVLLTTYTNSHSGRPITVKAETMITWYPPHILQKAKLLLEEVVDDRVRKAGKGSQGKVPKLVYVSNFEHVHIGSTIVQNQPKSTKGFIVFNAHTSFVQHYGAQNNVTREIALQVIDSVLNGRFPRGKTYDEIKAFVRKYHLLEYEVVHVDGVEVYSYKCRCKGGRKEGECSHEAAAEEINKTFSVSEQLQLIKGGTVKGRPKLRQVVAFKAHRPEELTVNQQKDENDFRKLVREPIVQFFDKPFSPDAFVGTVTGTLHACSNVANTSYIKMLNDLFVQGTL